MGDIASLVLYTIIFGSGVIFGFILHLPSPKPIEPPFPGPKIFPDCHSWYDAYKKQEYHIANFHVDKLKALRFCSEDYILASAAKIIAARKNKEKET